MEAIDAFFVEHAHTVGVLLVEPQWGSSQCGLPWPPVVLHHLVTRAKAHGIMVCADEIMCGLGRHGLGTLFASSHASLGIANLVDAVTFGKAIAGGCGDLLAGVAVKHGAAKMGESGRSALQSHTYAGASTRALLTATEVLRELPSCLTHVQQAHALIEEHLASGFSSPTTAASSPLSPSYESSSSIDSCYHEASGYDIYGRSEAKLGASFSYLTSPSRPQISDAVAASLRVQGQGLLWGAQFTHCDPSERRRAVQLLGQHCSAQHVGVYLVPASGGFMVSPPLDCAESENGRADLTEALQRLQLAVNATVAELNWPASELLTSPIDASSANSDQSNQSNQREAQGASHRHVVLPVPPPQKPQPVKMPRAPIVECAE